MGATNSGVIFDGGFSLRAFMFFSTCTNQISLFLTQTDIADDMGVLPIIPLRNAILYTFTHTYIQFECMFTHYSLLNLVQDCWYSS